MNVILLILVFLVAASSADNRMIPWGSGRVDKTPLQDSVAYILEHGEWSSGDIAFLHASLCEFGYVTCDPPEPAIVPPLDDDSVSSLGEASSPATGMTGSSHQDGDLDFYTLREVLPEAKGKRARMAYAYALLHGSFGFPCDTEAATEIYREVSSEVVGVLKKNTPPRQQRIRLDNDRHVDFFEREDDDFRYLMQSFEASVTGVDRGQFAYRIASHYQNGFRGVEVNHTLACEYFRISAENGHTPGKTQYAQCLKSSWEGIEANETAAFELYKEAADEGDMGGMMGVGQMSFHARGVPRNISLADEYFTKSAELGNSNAMYYLGLMYYVGYKGDNNNRNYRAAAEHFEDAANHGHVVSHHYLGEIYSHHHFSSRISEDHKPPVDYGKASNHYKVIGEYAFGDLRHIFLRYDEGDYDTALLGYQLWGAMGYSVAQMNAAFLLYYYHDYFEGKIAGVWTPARWYEEAACQEIDDALVALGNCYYDGTCGVSRNLSMSFELYSNASDRGSGRAAFNLGWMYLSGDVANLERNRSLLVEHEDSMLSEETAKPLTGNGKHQDRSFDQNSFSTQTDASHSPHRVARTLQDLHMLRLDDVRNGIQMMRLAGERETLTGVISLVADFVASFFDWALWFAAPSWTVSHYIAAVAVSILSVLMPVLWWSS
eukprot:Rmarinus@m.3677